MSGIGRRLARLHRHYPPVRPSPLVSWDFSALTPLEQYELDQLLAKVQEAPRHADGRADFSVFPNEELERLNALAERITAGKDA
jgi:hypothetical protein